MSGEVIPFPTVPADRQVITAHFDTSHGYAIALALHAGGFDFAIYPNGMLRIERRTPTTQEGTNDLNPL